MDTIKCGIFAALLLYASLSDIRKREVPDTIPVMIGITALIGITLTDLPSMFIAGLAITVPQLLISMQNPGSYGGADMKVMASSAFLLGLQRGLFAIIIGLSVGVLVTVVSRLIEKRKISESFPVVPYLAAGSLVAYLL